jgi:hypothetical protein
MVVPYVEGSMTREIVADARAAPRPRRKLGIIFVLAGVGVWILGAILYFGNVMSLLPTIPFLGAVVTLVGGFLEAVGLSLVTGEPVFGPIEHRRTSLAIVIPALVLFGGLLVGAALLFAENLEGPASLERWITTTVLLLLAIGIVSALIRDVLLRFNKSPPPGQAAPPARR